MFKIHIMHCLVSNHEKKVVELEKGLTYFQFFLSGISFRFNKKLPHHLLTK